MSPGLVADVVMQHATDAAFLWLFRDGASSAPHYSLSELSKLDGRVEAHLDGLRVAGDDGWELCRKELAWKEPGEVFAAAVLAFESGSETRIEEVLAVGEGKVELTRGLTSALGWLPFSQAGSRAMRLLRGESPSARRAGVAAFAVHREDPGEVMRRALRGDEPSLRARACKAVGELGRRDLVPDVIEAMSSDDAEVRFWGAWSAVLLDADSRALMTLQTIAEAQGPRQESALIMAVRRLEPGAARAWQQNLALAPKTMRQAVIAAGAIGDPEAIPWLIGEMQVLPLARVAGEAFSMITGVGIGYRDLERTPPEDFNAGPTEDPKDENVEMDPDENLPWPDPALVEKWWGEHRGEFRRGTRHLCGQPLSPDWLKTVLCAGYQRQRIAAALELAIARPDQPLFNVRAPGFRQLQALGKAEPIR